ncbi:MAG: lysophospholipid acyltransferase family protein [Thermoplasmatota archaeon]
MEDQLDMSFVEKILPVFKRLRNYSRVKVDGMEHIPDGPAILVGNHTGWLGLDYVFTALSVHEALGRMVRGMAHPAWFKHPATGTFARRCGIIEISKGAMAKRLEVGDLIMMFPEGEKGAFRPGSDYTLEPFARGFVRVAMETGVPVIPVCILGGEEANPVGQQLQSYEELVNLKGGLPVPKNLIPKPVKWRIRFLPPLDLAAYGPEDAGDHDLVHTTAENTRARIQRELRIMKVERGHPYL